MEKTVRLIDIANRIDDNMNNQDAKEILKVIGEYSKALDLLDEYDHKNIRKVKSDNSTQKISYEEGINIINKLKFNENSNIFALERSKGLKAIIGAIYQTFDNKDVYPSTIEKAANFLYLLYKEGSKVIDNNTLTALTLLIAEI